MQFTFLGWGEVKDSGMVNICTGEIVDEVSVVT
jgi:hypothetical protein